jgi:hypothetical protein
VGDAVLVHIAIQTFGGARGAEHSEQHEDESMAHAFVDRLDYSAAFYYVIAIPLE